MDTAGSVIEQFVLFWLKTAKANCFDLRRCRGKPSNGWWHAEQRKTLPDSVVVLTADGRLLVRSEAFLHILRRLGGAWKVVAVVLGVVPRGLRDFVYDFVARVRFHVFGRREDLCPVMPAELRARFDS